MPRSHTPRAPRPRTLPLPAARLVTRRAAIALAATGLVVGPLTPAALADTPAGTQVTLFNINDFHGRIASTAKPLACTLVSQESAVTAAGGSSVFLSAGDNIGASEFASYIQDDEPTIAYLNALGLKASALGNHEYDRGQDDLTGRVEQHADFTYLAANVYHADGTRAATPYTIVDAGKVTVAVVGADTADTPSLVSPSGIDGLEFRDPVDSVNQAIAELKASGQRYDVLAVEYHEGSSQSATQGSAPGDDGELFTRIVNDTSADADVIFNGHTHQSYAFTAPVPGRTDEVRPILQTGSYGANLGAVTLQRDAQGDWDVTDGGARLVPTAGADLSACASDPTYAEAAGIADAAAAQGKVESAKPVGSISGDVTTAYAPSKAEYGADGRWRRTASADAKGDDRASTSALSNELAESMVWATQQPGYGGAKATIGVMNPGGVRADLFHAASGAEGDGVVTYGEANDVVPFVNNLATEDLTGAQVKELLEQQWQRDADGNVPSRPYLALGLSKNVSYTFDATREEGDRITSITVDGSPIDLGATYTVVAATFLTGGGDNFRAFTEGTNLQDTGLLDRDAWIDYLSAHEDLAPDYSQRGASVQVTNPDAAGTASDPWTLHIGKLESRSLGAPRIDSVTVTVDGTAYTAPYTQDANGDWGADVRVSAPTCKTEGTYEVTLTTAPDVGTSITRQLPASESCSAFSDVGPGDLFYGEIQWLAGQGISSGFPDGTFRPTRPVGRDAMAEYLYRMAGSPAVAVPRSQPFSDVRPGMEHYEAIMWAYQNGIVKGFADGSFRPTAAITRDAMAAFLYRYAGSPQVARPASAPFRDVPVGSQFAVEIAWMKAQGLATGWSDGTFRPLASTNRDAMAAFLYRMSTQAHVSYLSQKGTRQG